MKTVLEEGEAAERVVSVTEFTRRVKVLLEEGIAPCWIRGEVSNLRAQASGHVYFSLKDAGAQVSAVMFRGDAARQAVVLRDGLQVVVFGQISVYEVRGQYQVIVRAVVDDGEGRLQREFNEMKRRLEAEGLFARERKKALPKCPQTVGFITSPTGAAVQDFVRILRRRDWRGRLVILPSNVQGAGAAREMAEMLRQAQALGFFDLLVIGRGGGSLEDLWAFNEEELVRAVAACEVPVISAVGHEIDFTLCDFAADVRAETPSGAAELISSQFWGLRERAERVRERVQMELARQLAGKRERVGHVARRLRAVSPAASLERGFLRLDDLRLRMAMVLERDVARRRRRLDTAAGLLVLRSPERRVELESQRLLSLWQRLQAASPDSVLKRGFVIVRDEAGKPLTRSAQVGAGQCLRVGFADGEVAARAL